MANGLRERTERTRGKKNALVALARISVANERTDGRRHQQTRYPVQDNTP
jgi:hypothetical protein